MCLRQQQTLRNLASLSVFQVTFSLSQLELIGRTLFDQYVYAAESPLVHEYKVVPHTDLTLKCSFVRDKLRVHQKI